MTVSFNYIPSNLRLPLFWAEVDPSQAGTFANHQRALVIGYGIDPGAGIKPNTMPANTPTRIGSKAQAADKAGIGPLAGMLRAWFDNNAFDEVWAMRVEPPVPYVKAAGAITVTGTASESGVLSLYIAGRRINVGVTKGQTATTIMAAITTALQPPLKYELPLAAVYDAVNSKVALTAHCGGIEGNAIDVRVNYRGALGGEKTPAGLTVTITAMSGGSGTAGSYLDDAIAALGDEEFDTVVVMWPDATSLDVIEAEWAHDNDNGRWSWLRQIYGHVYTARDGTVGELQAFGATRNGAHTTCWGYNGSPTPAWERAAAYAARAHRALLNDPARPLHTLELTGVLPAVPALRFTKGEKNSLAFDGISCAKETDDGKLAIETSFTMYQTNASGIDDNAFLKVQTPATLAYVLRSLRYRILQKYPRHKLANDGTRFGAGQAIVTPNVVRAELVAHYRELEYRGLVENAEAFKRALIVERNADDPNRLDVLYAPDLVNQLDVFAVLAQFRLQYPAALPDQPMPIA